MNRTPERLQQLATDLDVVNNFCFLPHRRVLAPSTGIKGTTVTMNGAPYVVTAQLTVCNCYASVFMAALGVVLPPIKANEQVIWLSSNEGKMGGWFEGNQTLAIERAALGYPTLVIATDQPKGHVGVVMPSPKAEPAALYVSAAGASNFVYAPAVKSFGVELLKRARYFTHN